jgi:DNA topoisomerase-2
VKFRLHFNEPAKDVFNLKDFKLQTKILSSNMHLFDSNNIIKKYDNVQQILEDFYQVRMNFYVSRKDEMIKMLKSDMVEANAKKRFIEYVIAKKIPILGIKKQVLEEEYLVKLDFPKIDDSYNYLLNLPIQSLTAERIDALTKEVKVLADKIKEYENTTVQQMWLKELDEFVLNYKNSLEQYLAAMTGTKSASKTKSKK